MSCKDLEKKVDDIDGRVGSLIKTVFELTDEKKFLKKKILKLQYDMAKLSIRLASVAKVSNPGEEGNALPTQEEE